MSDHYITVDNHFYAQSGFAFPSTTFEDNGIPIVRMSDLKDGQLRFENTKYVGESWLNLANEYLLKENDFLLGMSGSLSNYAVVTKDKIPAFLNQRVARLKSKASEHSYEYVAYWLKSHFYLQYAEIQGEGAAQKNISAKQIGLFRYRNASKLEQFKIVKILSAIDQAIEKTEALIEKYQQIKAGLMQDLFTRGIGEDGKLRPPREQAPALYQQTPTGWIPKEWKVSLLASLLLDIQAGKSPNCIDIPATTGDWGVLKVSAVHPDGFRSDQNKSIASLSHIESSYEVKSGDLLMSRANTPDLVGLVCLVSDPQPKLMLCDKTLKLIVNQSIASTNFIFFCMQQHYVRNQIEISATGTSMSMKNIGQSAIRAISVAFPPLEEQLLIVGKLNSIESRLLREKLISQKLQKQKSGLMCDLLSGKVQVPIITTEAEHV